ncbi:MAG: tRNA-dihydrouridine synthase family protein [Bacteriovoracaceae bacterium]|nr:tRNA-dihydrouridine synthase family protein [Bacteriovoracaceae bacterium]
MITKDAVIFAPLESITDFTYRKVIHDLYPQWDAYYSDFLRVPAVGVYPAPYILKHYGTELVSDEFLKQKTALQILTAPGAMTEKTVQQIQSLQIPWLDLNLGCPSKTVNKRAGGAALLGQRNELWEILKTIRKNFHGFFSVKIRLGISSTDEFLDNIKMVEDLGIDAITVHARTRDGMYKVPAEWSHIKAAVKAVSIPIIGNGDIWCPEDAVRIKNETNCHAIMVARGAMKSPWMAKHIKDISHDEYKNPEFISSEIKKYFFHLKCAYEKKKYTDYHILKQFKNLSRYLFDDLPQGKEIKQKFLLSQNLNDVSHWFTE